MVPEPCVAETNEVAGKCGRAGRALVLPSGDGAELIDCMTELAEAEAEECIRAV